MSVLLVVNVIHPDWMTDIPENGGRSYASPAPSMYRRGVTTKRKHSRRSAAQPTKKRSRPKQANVPPGTCIIPGCGRPSYARRMWLLAVSRTGAPLESAATFSASVI